jgi:hypothetical protein
LVESIDLVQDLFQVVKGNYHVSVTSRNQLAVLPPVPDHAPREDFGHCAAMN